MDPLIKISAYLSIASLPVVLTELIMYNLYSTFTGKLSL